MGQSNLVDERKISRNIFIFWTLIYVILFIPLLMWTSCVSLIAYEDHTVLIGIIYIILFFCLLLSLPISIYLMWVNYCRDRLERAHFAWMLPIIALIVEVTIEFVLRLLQ